MARDVDSLTLSIQHSLPTAASPTLPGGFGEAIEASDGTRRVVCQMMNFLIQLLGSLVFDSKDEVCSNKRCVLALLFYWMPYLSQRFFVYGSLTMVNNNTKCND